MDVAGRDGTLLGKGIVNYDAADLQTIAGLQSAKARELLPWGAEEAVHRDYFVRA